MSEFSPDHEFSDIMEGIRGTIASVQGGLLGLDKYEYLLAPPDELNERGADRWRLVPMPPLQIKQSLAGPIGSVLFVMERQLLADDADLAQMSAQPAFCSCPAGGFVPHPVHELGDE